MKQSKRLAEWKTLRKLYFSWKEDKKHEVSRSIGIYRDWLFQSNRDWHKCACVCIGVANKGGSYSVSLPAWCLCKPCIQVWGLSVHQNFKVESSSRCQFLWKKLFQFSVKPKNQISFSTDWTILPYYIPIWIYCDSYLISNVK